MLIGEPEGGICGHAWRTWGLLVAAPTRSPSSSTSSPASPCREEEVGGASASMRSARGGGRDEACSRVQGSAHAVPRMQRGGGSSSEARCDSGPAHGALSMQRPCCGSVGTNPGADYGSCCMGRERGSDGGARDGPGALRGVQPRTEGKRAREGAPAPGLGPRQDACRRQAPRREHSAAAPVAPYLAEGFERVDLPALSAWQACRTDERWLARRHSACVAFRRR